MKHTWEYLIFKSIDNDIDNDELIDTFSTYEQALEFANNKSDLTIEAVELF